MDNQTGRITHLQLLLNEFYAAGEHTRLTVKHELLGCYYQLTAQERLTMRAVMQPFIDEIEQEMVQKDPLARQANELLNRLADPIPVVK